MSPEELLRQVESTNDLDLLAVRLALANAADLDERLPDAIRLSALPRTIEPNVLGALRDDDDRNINEQLLSMMADLGMVSGPPGRLSFHDVTRNALLRDWQQLSEERASEFTELNAVLIHHYEDQLDRLVRLSREFARLSSVIRSANSRRWGRLKSELERRISAAARDAAYHAFVVSPGQGMEVVKEWFERLVDAGWIGVLERLIDEARHHLAELVDDDEQPEHDALIRYFTGRLSRQADSDPVEAEAILQAAKDDEHLPGRYRLWAADDLALLLEERMELGRALELREQLATEVYDEDPWNAPLWSHTLGLLWWRLGDRQRAVRAMEKSLAVAESDRCRRDMRLKTVTVLANLRFELGDVPAAGEAISSAFHLGRTEFTTDQVSIRFMAQTFGWMLATFDARASEASFVEAMGLTGDDSGAWMDLFGFWTAALFECGGSSRLAPIERQLADRRGANGDESDAGNLDLLLGMIAEARGNLQGAIERFSVAETKGRRQASIAVEIDAMAGRIRCSLRLGEWRNVKRTVKWLRPVLEKVGAGARLAQLDIDQARLLLELGDLSACDALLTDVRPRIPAGCTWDSWQYLRVRAELHLRQGQFALADEVCREALASSRARRVLTGEIDRLRFMLQIAEEMSDWTRLPDLVGQLEVVSSRLAREASVTFAGDDAKAQQRNSSAIREFSDPNNTSRADTLLAARNHLTAAVGLDPDCFWYRLNLSYALAEQGEWTEARLQLEVALRAMPTALRGTAFWRQLATLTLEEALVRAVESPAEALNLLAERLDSDTNQLPAPDRRKLALVAAALAAMSGDAARLSVSVRQMGPSADISTADKSEVATRLLGLRREGQRCWTPQHYWTSVDQLRSASRRIDSENASANLRNVEIALAPLLTDWLGLNEVGVGDLTPTPIRLEVAENLRAVVDNSSFLVDILGSMRDQIATDTGVLVPPIRVSTGDLPIDSFRVLLHDFEVDRGYAPAKGLAVCALDPGRAAGMPLYPKHPGDGAPGPWLLITPDDRVEPADVLGPERILAAALGRQLRTHLDVLAPVDEMVAGITDAPVDRSTAASPDDGAAGEELNDLGMLRLGWLCRALVRDGVPVRSHSLFEAVAAAGGLDVPTPVLVAAVRAMQRQDLPGNEPNRDVRELPKDFAETALMVDRGASGESLRAAYRNWLRTTVAQSGPWLTVVVPSEALRLCVAELTRSEEPLVGVLAAAEVIK